MPNKPVRLLPHLSHHIPWLHVGLVLLQDPEWEEKAFDAVSTFRSDDYVQRRVDLAPETEALIQRLAELLEEPHYKVVGAAQITAATDPMSPYRTEFERERYASVDNPFAEAARIAEDLRER